VLTVILFTSLLSILAVEYFVHLPFIREARSLFVVGRKSVRAITSTRVSDHWKERVLVHYLQQSIRSTFFLILILLGLFVWIGFGAYAVDKLINPQPTVIDALANPIIWIYMAIISSIYLYSRKRIVLSNNSDYSLIERELHRLALGSSWIGRISLAMDCALSRDGDSKNDERHIFICGLARSGSTILMRAFYETENYRSLSYRDMPFVLMPRIWKILSRPYQTAGTERERAHQDGIMVAFDSPEAFEEVFWKAFSSSDYLDTSHLAPHSASEEVINYFQKFVDQVISSADQQNIERYLSKNNNNILRISSIRRAFPNALIIVPYREPVQQAISLFEQHKHFCKLQAVDSFISNYMEWLGHYEFGINHRPFQFGERWAIRSNNHDPGDVNYWLALWIDTYRYLFETSTNNVVFTRYEDLCTTPNKTIKNLFMKANIDPQNISNKLEIVSPKIKELSKIDKNLERQAFDLYQDLPNQN
jgi:hypothetical protein